ncbi:hypothetical protein [Streptomyces sp. NBC_00199]|uniref:hypothetical protein n=1 Tax=Streptomyces sp. NBC_00199 TaxID=2975678 RepID=UPI00225166BB|nr:hypothetical protein [Streptomyces sp. NBC_00199]MCX5262427.1 hypothetical protein [Streptomyces sp. NBC_00199]MCX5269363.1 hypothetical protein [Streptomyces sp. NBC_00199]MCX5269795.1 hypothetical protein [Streptomyces sp. NBC_00199]
MQPHFTGTALITADVPALAAFEAAVLDADAEGRAPFARVTVPAAVLSSFSTQGTESMTPGSTAAAARRLHPTVPGHRTWTHATNGRRHRALTSSSRPRPGPGGHRSAWLPDPDATIVNLHQDA